MKSIPKKILHYNLIDTSKHDLTEGTISTKAILHPGGLRIRRKSRYRSLKKVWSKNPLDISVALLRRFRLVERGSLRGMVFGYPCETGLEDSPCKFVGYIGLNAPVVEERKKGGRSYMVKPYYRPIRVVPPSMPKVF